MDRAEHHRTGRQDLPCTQKHKGYCGGNQQGKKAFLCRLNSRRCILFLKKGLQEPEHLVVPGAALQPPGQALNKPVFYKELLWGPGRKNMIILTGSCQRWK